MQFMVYDSHWQTLGGGEKYLCTVADTVSRHTSHTVSLVVDTDTIGDKLIHDRFHLDLDQVSLLRVKRRDVRPILRSADVAVIMSNVRPFGLPAPTTVYVIQIPYPRITVGSIGAKLLTGGIREAARDILRTQLLHDARRSSGVLVYSEFCARTLSRDHAIRSRILHPPIDDFSTTPPILKEKVILSVGRIFRGLYNDKRYDILIDAFRTLLERYPGLDWQYWIVGSCREDRASRAYLEELTRRASGLPMRIFVNVSHHELKERYARASIFWHAAGYEVDETKHPDRAEHFGMSTAEAMSASCVPLVPSRGGQREIVSDGESGYLWTTVDDLVSRTAGLIGAPDRMIVLREAARNRARDFQRDVFDRSLLTLLAEIETERER